MTLDPINERHAQDDALLIGKLVTTAAVWLAVLPCVIPFAIVIGAIRGVRYAVIEICWHHHKAVWAACIEEGGK